MPGLALWKTIKYIIFMKTIHLRSIDRLYSDKWEEAQSLSGQVSMVTTYWDRSDSNVHVTEIHVPDNYVPYPIEAVSKIEVDERIQMDNGDIVHVTGKLTCFVENY